MKSFLFILLIFSFTFSNAQVDETRSYIDSLLNQANLIGSQDSEEAKIILDIANELAIKTDYISGRAEAMRLFGLLKFYKVDYSGALKLFNESRDLFNSADNLKGKAKAMNNIAVLYQYQELNDKALDIYNDVIEIYLSINDSLGYAGILNNMANTFSDKKDFFKALEYYKKSVEIYTNVEYSSKRELSRTYNNIGGVFLNLNMPDSAILYLENSLAIRKEINEIQGIKNSYQTIGMYYVEIEDYETALEYLEESLRISFEIDIPYEIESAAKDLFEVYAILGDYKNAYNALLTYNRIRDESKNDDIIRIITSAELEARFEKEQELQRLLQEEKEFEQKHLLTRQIRIRNTLIISVLLLILISYLIYRGYKIKQKHVRLLNEQTQEILEKNDELNMRQQEIISQRNEIEKHRDILELTNQALKESNKKITDNIHYAKTIQRTILPYKNDFEQFSKDNFVIYKPCDIVSGDFYWYEKFNGYDIFALGDCTGHGVPGALMTMIADGILKKVLINKKTDNPAKALKDIHYEIINTLKQQDDHYHNYDGMDLALLFIDTKKKKAVYSGANISLYISNTTGFSKIDSDKISLGGIKKKTLPDFNNKEFSITSKTQIYLCSDGLFDQMSPVGEKYGRRRFENLLKSVIALPMPQQKEILEKDWNKHKGDENQIDDTSLIGFEF
ncbi:MAG: tetratricopeptide repeat protein [Bacteroidota bacterium]